jgi:hypothetical protein
MDTDITLDGSVSTWVLPLTQGDLGGTYKGKFTFKCYLNPLEQLQAGREYRELLGALAMQASDTESNLAFALIQCKHRILTAPPFWTSTKQESSIEGNIGDLNIVSMVLDAAIRSEALFKQRIAEEREALLDHSIKTAESMLKKEE